MGLCREDPLNSEVVSRRTGAGDGLDLSGNTAVFGPISILQLMNLAQTTGELVLHVSPTTARIYFDRGSVTYAEINNRRVKLGEFLVQQELISRATLERALL